MWSERIEAAGSADEEKAPKTAADSPDDQQFTLSEPSGWPTGKPSISSLNRMKKAELVTLAKERGVSHSGTKAQIIDALREEE